MLSRFLISLHLLVISGLIGAPLVINEFVSSNGSTIADEDGDYSDWIELYYFGAESIELEGFGLSDNAGSPFKWRFPNIVMEPQSYLLVWASGKNRRETAGELHTSFAISAAGEPLLLTDPAGNLVDFVEPVGLLRDQAFARIPDGGEWSTTSTPTPGRANMGFAGEVPSAPVILSSGGIFNGPLLLRIESDSPAGSEIIYTRDGSVPTREALAGSVYWYKNYFPVSEEDEPGEFLRFFPRTFTYNEAGIAIEGEGLPFLYRRTTTMSNNSDHYRPEEPPYTGHVIRARTVSLEGQYSDVVTKTFFPEVERMPTLGHLPIVAVTVPSFDLFDYYTGIFTPGFFYDRWRHANFFLTGSEHEKRGSFEMFDPFGRPLIQRNVGVRIHGGATRVMAQKSLRISSGSVFDSKGELEHDIFPELIGRTTGLPITRFRNILLRNSGNDSRGTRFRDMLGQAVMEPMGLDYQAWQPALQFINGEFWGLINIRERMDRFTISRHHGIPEDDVAIVKITAQGEELDEGEWTDLEAFLALREFIGAVDEMDDEKVEEIAGHLDIDNFITYHVGNIFLKNTDWPGSNIRVWRTREPSAGSGQSLVADGRWRYIVYDLDFAFAPAWGIGNHHDTLAFALEAGGTSWPNPDWSTLMLRRLVENTGFRNRFIQSFADHWNTTFQEQRVYGLIHYFERMLEPLLPFHAERWRDFANEGGDKYRNFISNRSRYMRDHLLNAFGFPGYGQLEIDLSDPAAGEVRLNTIRLNRQTPGLVDPQRPFPWRGTYARGVPMMMEAVAYPGYEFIGWEREGERVPGAVQEVVLTETEHRWVALFRRTAEQQLLHYWDFNEWDKLELPYWTIGGGQLTVQGEIGSTWQFPTSLQGLTGEGSLFGQPLLVHLGIEQESLSAIELAVPSGGHDELELRYETRRSAIGPGFQWVEVSTDGGGTYQLVSTVALQSTQPQMVRVSLGGVVGAADNADLRLRIRVGGGAGQVFFDDMAIWGRPMLGSAQALAWSGTAQGAGWFEVPGLGTVYPSGDDERFLYRSGDAWLYVAESAEAAGEDGLAGTWLYHYGMGLWLNAHPQAGGWLYEPVAGEWITLEE